MIRQTHRCFLTGNLTGRPGLSSPSVGRDTCLACVSPGLCRRRQVAWPASPSRASELGRRYPRVGWCRPAPSLLIVSFSTGLELAENSRSPAFSMSLRHTSEEGF